MLGIWVSVVPAVPRFFLNTIVVPRVIRASGWGGPGFWQVGTGPGALPGGLMHRRH